jgi:hypothetical protein
MRIIKFILMLVFVTPALSFAQGPPNYPPPQLDQLIGRIALYPDPLVAQILAAATYPDQIPDAAQWADQHHYLRGPALADAIQGDQLPWDPSVQALLPFPSVLEMMSRDMNWTADLGNAFLAEQHEVMEAIQRERRKARDYGYLRSNGQIVVAGGPYITIMPANPAFVVVPYYDPGIVYFPPRPGFFVGGGIRFGFGVALGGSFRPWGWGYDRFDWDRHDVFINNSPWRRNWDNRVEYRHPYEDVHRYGPGDRVPERHDLHERSERERGDEREGRREHEEHRGGEDRGHDRGGDHDHR